MARLLVLPTLVLALAGTAGACMPSRAASASRDGAATVVSVTDGDTIDVDLGGDVEPVRLLGIDTSNPANLHPAPALPRRLQGCRSGQNAQQCTVL